MDDTYQTIAAPSEGIYKEKGSKFMAFAYPVHYLTYQLDKKLSAKETN